MTKEQTIELLCAIMGLAFNSIADYSEACDCVCKTHSALAFDNYSNNGAMLKFLHAAVVEKLDREGYAVSYPGDRLVQSLLNGEDVE